MHPCLRLCSLVSFLCGILQVALALPVAGADSAIEEKYASGKLRGKYLVNSAGEKDGSFTEYYENGKTRAKGTFKSGKLEGEYAVNYPGGSPMANGKFAAGVPIGTYTEFYSTGGTRLTMNYQDGSVTGLKMVQGGKTLAAQDFAKDSKWLPPRRLADIQLDLADAASIPPAPKKADALQSEREAALRRLMAYRAVAGVPFRDLALDDDLNTRTAVAAELCQALGRNEHRPTNTVGWPDEKFKIAADAALNSNLNAAQPPIPLAKTVDLYMDDSTPKNLDTVSHRRWCLNPAMSKTGFAKSPSGMFTAMWASNSSRAPIPEYDYVAYPPTGFAPANYFGARVTWSVSLNPARLKLPPGNDVTVKMYAKTDRTADTPGSEIPLDHMRVSTEPRGHGPAVIFRPAKCSLDEGTRYVVVIEGLINSAGEKVTVSYMVIFVGAV